MTQSGPTTIRPSTPKLIGIFVFGNLIMAAGLLGIYVGLGKTVALVCAIPAACIGLVSLLSLVLRKPYIRITATGFEFRNLFGTRSIQWADVQGSFSVWETPNPIKLPGTGQLIVFNWTDAYKAKHGAKKTAIYGGFDTGFSGAFELPYEKLAGLLNETKQSFFATGE